MARLRTAFLTAAWLALVWFALAQAQGGSPVALVLTVDGPVTPVMAEYLRRGIRLAEQRDAEVVIFQLNTPGGAIDAMTDVVEVLRASRVPVVVYVAPRGAIAGSAGTVIALAGHLAAMAPETAIGAASPVGAQGEDIGETLESKVKEILKAQVRSLASWRGEEALRLAEATIESARAVSADEALDAGLIDLIAADLPDLLAQLDGRTAQTASGGVTLHTSGAQIVPVGLSLLEQLLFMLTNPNIVFILLSVGVQAVLIELSSPGGWVAGFLGVVCLALAGYGLGVLPVNWFGLVFLLMAFVLFILDLKAPTHGALTVAGISSLVVAALVMFNTPVTPPALRVSVPLVVGVSLATGGLFALALGFAVRAQKAPLRSGREILIGQVGVVKERVPARGVGIVHVAGELWSAESASGEVIPAGARVRVKAVAGLRLKVEKASEEN